MPDPTVREIVAEWLRAHGYDGLYSWHGCGCSVNDVGPCDGDVWECQAGFHMECADCDHAEDCEWQRSEDRCIGPKEA